MVLMTTEALCPGSLQAHAAGLHDLLDAIELPILAEKFAGRGVVQPTGRLGGKPARCNGKQTVRQSILWYQGFFSHWPSLEWRQSSFCLSWLSGENDSALLERKS